MLYASKKGTSMFSVPELVARAWVALQAWKATLIQRDDDGQGMVEYALILAFVALVTIVILTVLGQRVTNTFNNASTAIGTR